MKSTDVKNEEEKMISKLERVGQGSRNCIQIKIRQKYSSRPKRI